MFFIAQFFESEISTPWIPYHDLDLKLTGIITGAIVSLIYLFNIIQREKVIKILPKLPRNKSLGIIILSIAFLWLFLIINEVHLGEFYTLRGPALIILPIVYVLIIVFVDEFLTARALGLLFLLVAPILLDSAFLKEPTSRLLLVVLAYTLVLKGLFLIGKPYLMRDKIEWLIKSSKKTWILLHSIGLIYSLSIIICAILFW